MERWREDFHQKGKIQASARCTSMVYSADTEVSFLMSCSLKVTQYMDQTISQLQVFGCLSPRSYTGRQLLVNIKEKLIIYVAY